MIRMITLVLLTLIATTFGGSVKTQYKFLTFTYPDKQRSIYRGAAKGEFITNRDFDKGLFRAFPDDDEYEIEPIDLSDISLYPDVNLDVAPNGEAAMLIGKTFYLLDTKEWKILAKFRTPRGYSKDQQFIRYYPKQKRALAWVATVEQEDVYDPSFKNVDKLLSVDIQAGKFDFIDLPIRGGDGFLDIDDGVMIQYPDKWKFCNLQLHPENRPFVEYLNETEALKKAWRLNTILPSKSWAFAYPLVDDEIVYQLYILDWSSGKVVVNKQIFPYPTAENEGWQFFDVAPTGDRILLGSRASGGIFKAYLGLISRQEDNSVQARWIDIGKFDMSTGHIMGSWDATSTMFTIIQSHKQAYVWKLDDIISPKK